MKILVIHPIDRTTDFLKVIYEDINCTLVREPEKVNLHDMIGEHDRVVMLGHGLPQGLLSSRCPGGMAVDESLAHQLSQKPNNVYIWCHADQFVSMNDLSGFFTGMIISEKLEARMHKVNATYEDVRESNVAFAAAIKKHILEPDVKDMQLKVLNDYPRDLNEVTKYNHQRIFHA